MGSWIVLVSLVPVLLLLAGVLAALMGVGLLAALTGQSLKGVHGLAHWLGLDVDWDLTRLANKN